jgi:hypothetical protein
VPGAPDAGYDVYDTFIAELVAAEEQRKNSIEARATGVISTSGAIVTLLLALAAVATRQAEYVPPRSISGELLTATLLFVAGIVVALLVTAPLPFINAKPEELRAAVKELWTDPADVATKRTSATRVKFLYRAQMLNTIKAWALLVALALEVAAIGLRRSCGPWNPAWRSLRRLRLQPFAWNIATSDVATRNAIWTTRWAGLILLASKGVNMPQASLSVVGSPKAGTGSDDGMGTFELLRHGSPTWRSATTRAADDPQLPRGRRAVPRRRAHRSPPGHRATGRGLPPDA